MIESAFRAQFFVERAFAGMPERPVSEIVRQRQRLSQILIEPQRARGGACDLRDFDGVREAVAEIIAFHDADENLSLVLQPPERGRMDDAITVALVNGAIIGGMIRMRAPAGLESSLNANEANEGVRGEG